MVAVDNESAHWMTGDASDNRYGQSRLTPRFVSIGQSQGLIGHRTDPWVIGAQCLLGALRPIDISLQQEDAIGLTVEERRVFQP